jgi:hypothetical protein
MSPMFQMSLLDKILSQPDISANMECFRHPNTKTYQHVAEKYFTSQRIEDGQICIIFSATIREVRLN